MNKTWAYVLVSMEPRYTNETYRKICDTPGVKSAYQTTGRWDAICWVEGNGPEDICRTVIEKVRKIEGITRTETLFAHERM